MSDAGTTVSTSDDTALAGVDVTAMVGGTSTVAGTATTDVNGEFQIAGLAAGTYDLTFTKSGFDDQTMLGVSATFGGSGLFVLMHALEQDLQVTVNQTATAVSGATVEVKNLLGDVVASDTTDASGMVTFTGVPTGTYTVHVAFVDSTSTSVSGNKTVAIVGLSTSTTATVIFSFP